MSKNTSLYSCLIIYCLLMLPSNAGAFQNVVSTVEELQNAVGDIRSGDTIYINAGTYDLTSTLVVNNNSAFVGNVMIAGITGNRDDVILRCPGMGVQSPSAPHVFNIFNVRKITIRDLTAGWTLWHPISVQGAAGAENVSLINLRLVDAGEQFIKVNNGGDTKCDKGLVEGCLIEYTDYAYWNGDYYYTQGIDKIGGGNNWTLRGNTIRNIRPHPEHVNDADGCGAAITFWQGGSNNIIEKNIIINCRKGIELGISEGTGVDGGIIRNNIIYRDAGEVGGDMGILINDTPGAKVLNNTVMLNGTFDPGSGPRTIEYRFDLTTGLEIRNNLCDGELWQRTGELDPVISHNITNASSTFLVDAANRDFHLKDNALDAIDMGYTHHDVTDDFEGDARPYGNGFDIGADEFEGIPDFVFDIKENDFLISPNPAADHITITGDILPGSHYDIIDINGNTALSGTIQDTRNISLSDLVPGVFILRIKSSKKVQSGKFVVGR